MKHSIKFIAIICILLTTLESQAETKKRDLAKKLYVTSGLEKDINHMPEIMKNRANKDLKEKEFQDDAFAKDYIKFVNDLIDSTYSPKIYTEAIIDKFDKSMNTQQLEYVINWYKSPLGQKYIESANKYYGPDKQKEFDLFVKNLEQAPPTKNRIDLIREIERRTDYINFNTDMIINEQISATFATIYATTESTDQLTLDFIKTSIEAQRSYIKNIMDKKLINYLHFFYQEFNDIELNKMIEFFSSVHGNLYRSSINSATIEAHKIATFKFGQKIVDFCSSYHEQSKPLDS